MEQGVNSIHFLWAAYVLVAVTQVGYAAWIGIRWSRTKQ